MAKYHDLQEEIVNILTIKTQSKQYHFFRLLVAYYFTKMASTMRTNIQTRDRGVIPVNMYALNLAVSGAGKGHSTNIMEELIIDGFTEAFLENTLPTISKQNLQVLANDRAIRDNCPVETWTNRLQKEYDSLGGYAWNFDSATTPAVKQFRQKLLLSSVGSMNFEMDEAGSNFLSNMEVLATFLELFDKGLVKQKLTKNTVENTRHEEVKGYTPTNMMLFGTPVKLLDGSKTEDDFKQALETGYARRLFVGYSNQPKKLLFDNAVDLYNAVTDTSLDSAINRIRAYLRDLGSMSHINPVMHIDRDVTIELMAYKLSCEKKAADFAEHEEIFEAEMSHRYYKCLKLAGAYAFIDKTRQITSEHIKCAIQMCEDSGENFNRMMSKEGPYVRLAKYLATVQRPQTHVDLMENLAFFKGSKQDKSELINLASAWGCTNNIAIQRYQVDSVEFLTGETLAVTDLNSVQVSHSVDIANNYVTENPPFNKMHHLVCGTGYHYCSHGFEKGHRHKDQVLPGFNLAIIDVDDGTKIETAMALLDKYTALYATTKRHQKNHHRFRIIFPLSHYLKLSIEDHTRFMENLFNWLPFSVDTAPKDIARKWESFPGIHHYVLGELLDATRFIPKTQKEYQQQKDRISQSNMNRLERWFAQNIEIGNRSNMLLRFGYALLDSGKTVDEAEEELLDFNSKLTAPLNKKEVQHTICASLRSKK
ncbi:MAG TPA: primase C-terminal domain-containing protein [Candidatus Nanoarchaeia archaeon]|nr:primase C-terminal domain-containing protein [Candidatus Nanoarchaeia archaeon]